MSNFEIILPSRPKIILEEDNKGTYEMEGLYAGYGHTLGNSLRRVILSSLPGAAVTMVKIDGVNHEFSTMEGIKEDVIAVLLNIKKMRFNLESGEPVKATLEAKGVTKVSAGDFKAPSQLEILNKDLVIANLTDKKSKLNIEITVEKGLGYVPREVLKKEKVETGVLMLDAMFTPVKRVNYEVENMRVGDRTDYNKIRFLIETDGSISPREALENSIRTLIKQLSAVVGISEDESEKIIEESKFKQEEAKMAKIRKEEEKEMAKQKEEEDKEEDKGKEEEDFLKTRVEDINLSSRTINALSKAGIRTVGGLTRKKEEDLLSIDGLGEKALNEIRRALGNFGLILK